MYSEFVRPQIALSALLLLSLTAPVCAGDGEGSGEQASFSVTNVLTLQVPPNAQRVRVWFALPNEDPYSTVSNLKITSMYPVSFNRDSWGNRVGYLETDGIPEQKITITETFDFRRAETANIIDPAYTRSLTEAERNALARYLLPTTHVIVNDDIRKLAASIVGADTNPVVAARKLYDWTLQNVDYWVKDPDHLKASSVGSTDYCLTTKTGNCTDFHSLFASLAMASGVPVRMVYGSLLKPTLNGVQVDASYHCWIEFYAPNYGWLPLDVSLANIYGKEFPLTDKNRKLVELTTATGYHGVDMNKVEFYFGNLDDRRVVWSTGRDLMMQPPQDDGPVNSLSKMYVEVNGKQYTNWTRELSYKVLAR